MPARGWLGAAGAERRRRVAVAERLADWHQAGDRDQLMANISLVGGLLGPRGSWRDFVNREVLRPEEGAPASAAHAVKRTARYALALWKVRGGRRWVDPPRV